MSWVSLILATLKAITTLVAYANQRQSMQAGQDKEIARAALSILEATKTGKELRDRIAAMDDQGAEALWSKMVDG